jgi:polysaccharide export outer membrane protein
MADKQRDNAREVFVITRPILAVSHATRYPNRSGSPNEERLSVNLSIARYALTICGSAILVIGMVCPRTAEARHPGNSQESVGPVQQYANPSGDSNPDSSTGPKLKLSPIATLRNFEPPVNEEYTLGAGDEISIQYPGRPELASKDVIGPDGRITLPLAGPIEVANLTREAAGEKVVAALSAYYTYILAATVEVEKYGSNHVTLLGNVKSPGLINFDQTPTLLEVLSKGGIETRPDGYLPEQCVIYRGEQVLWVELQELLSDGSPLADMRLRRNDVIFVPALSTRFVTVMGQVQHPGEIVLRQNSTLTSVLGEAGGVSDTAGANPELQIVHRIKGGKTQYVRLKDLLKATGGMEISLFPGDVIYVPKSGLSRVGFVMQQLAPFLSLGSFAAIAAH